MALARFLVLLFVLAGLLSACGVRERVFGSRGQVDRALPFRATLASGEDGRALAVRVRDAGGATVADVRESARFPATRYCLERYGASDTQWAVDPVTGDWAFSREGQDMIFSGRCSAR